jgi:hypothetical protein
MTTHKTGTREQWLKARIELLQAEKELTQRGDELARQRQELRWVLVNKGYRFETDKGSASLTDLFQRRSQLLVYRPHPSSSADGHPRFYSRLKKSLIGMGSCAAALEAFRNECLPEPFAISNPQA